MSAFSDEAARWQAVADRMAGSLAIDVCRAQAGKFVEIERAVTPKRSGALAASEGIKGIGGGGAAASAVVSPDKVYAGIENYGGEISAKGGEVWKTVNGKSRMYRHTLHWGDTFALHVHHTGKGYVQRAEGIAQGSLTTIAEGVLAEILDI